MDTQAADRHEPKPQPPRLKARLLRIVWGIIPWVVVAGLIASVFVMGKWLILKHGQLAEAKSAAIEMKQVPAVRVITLTLAPQRLADAISLPGEIKPYEDLSVKTEAKGQIVAIPVAEGQDVKKDQLLMQIDDRDYRVRLARIEASYRLAKLNYERIDTLARKKIAPLGELDEATATLKELEAQLAEARLALQRTRIRAPLDGRLNEILKKSGDVVDVNQPVARIIQIDRVKATVGVPESDVAAVFDLKQAEVVIEALGNRKIVGQKVFLSSQPRSLARLYELELRLPNPDGRILPGMFAEVKLVKKVYENAVAVPLYAVITQGDARYVYVEKDGKAERRDITMGVLVDWQVHVTSGLNPGDRVIVVGHRFLESGQVVQVVKNVEHPEEIFAS